jgi:hypothetical protein
MSPGCAKARERLHVGAATASFSQMIHCVNLHPSAWCVLQAHCRATQARCTHLPASNAGSCSRQCRLVARSRQRRITAHAGNAGYAGYAGYAATPATPARCMLKFRRILSCRRSPVDTLCSSPSAAGVPRTRVGVRWAHCKVGFVGMPTMLVQCNKACCKLQDVTRWNVQINSSTTLAHAFWCGGRQHKSTMCKHADMTAVPAQCTKRDASCKMLS